MKFFNKLIGILGFIVILILMVMLYAIYVSIPIMIIAGSFILFVIVPQYVGPLTSTIIISSYILFGIWLFLRIIYQLPEDCVERF